MGQCSSDNGDGTRSFVWAPSEALVGEHEFVLEAFDAVDVTLFSSQTLRVNVLDSLSNESNNFPLK